MRLKLVILSTVLHLITLGLVIYLNYHLKWSEIDRDFIHAIIIIISSDMVFQIFNIGHKK